jgi:2-polyprenyl-6-methoxyphenol hydroxylase-like FAD-dependent oxidoreductase
MGGLSAARVLADFYETVTVVERDVLPDEAGNRRGVPQGRHGHAILGRGLAVLSEIFPRFTDDLVEAGAPVLDYHDLSETDLTFGGHRMPRTGGFANVPALFMPSRPVLESLVRRRLRAISHVHVLDGYDVTGLTCDASGRRVAGAHVKAHAGGREHHLSADLVVDATGRAARTPAFLEALGYGKPPVEQVKVRVAYSSQLLAMPSGTLREKILLASPVPGRSTGMALLSHENDTWLFTAFGIAGTEPPSDFSEMISFAHNLAPRHILDALRSSEALCDVAVFRYPESRWRRFDKLRRLPDGLVVVGDAMCSFNPIYGQGMTVAMLEAQALGRCLRRGTDDLVHRYFHAAAKPVGVAWQFSTGADLNLPEVEGKRGLSVRISNRYAERIQTVAETDLEVAEQFQRVVGLLDPPAKLIRPKMLMRAALRRPRTATPQSPKVLAKS